MPNVFTIISAGIDFTHFSSQSISDIAIPSPFSSSEELDVNPLTPQSFNLLFDYIQEHAEGALEENVAYIEGYTDAPSHIGDVIVSQLYCILTALSQGATTINLVCHGPAAHASFIVMHELARLKKEPSTAPTIERLMQTQYDYLQNALKQSEVEIGNIPSFDNVCINIFALDPILAMGTHELDQRALTLPPVVSQIVITLFQDDRSEHLSAFIPSIEQPDITHMSQLSLPGHHFTGTGMLLDQLNDARFSLVIPFTRDVQRIVLFEIILFLQSHGVEWDRTFLERIDLSLLMLLVFYNRINNQDAKRAFELLAAHKYSLNKEGQVVCSASIETERLVNFMGERYPLPSLIPMPRGHINTRHAQLLISWYLQGDARSYSLPHHLSSLCEQLSSLCEQLEQDPESTNAYISLILPPLFQSIYQSYFNGVFSVLEDTNLSCEIIRFLKLLDDSLISEAYKYIREILFTHWEALKEEWEFLRMEEPNPYSFEERKCLFKCEHFLKTLKSLFSVLNKLLSNQDKEELEQQMSLMHEYIAKILSLYRKLTPAEPSVLTTPVHTTPVPIRVVDEEESGSVTEESFANESESVRGLDIIVPKVEKKPSQIRETRAFNTPSFKIKELPLAMGVGFLICVCCLLLLLLAQVAVAGIGVLASALIISLSAGVGVGAVICLTGSLMDYYAEWNEAQPPLEIRPTCQPLSFLSEGGVVQSNSVGEDLISCPAPPVSRTPGIVPGKEPEHRASYLQVS